PQAVRKMRLVDPRRFVDDATEDPSPRYRGDDRDDHARVMVGQVLIQALVWVVSVEVLLILRQHGAGAGFDQRRSRGEDCPRQRIRRLNSANTPPLRPVRWLSLSERNNASARPCSATVVRSAREKRRSGVTITVPALTLQV